MTDRVKEGWEVARRISVLRSNAPAVLIALGGSVAVIALALFLFAGLPDFLVFVACGFMGTCYMAATALVLWPSRSPHP